MSLIKLKSAPVILIEDDASKNIIPLLLELVPNEKFVNIFCYEQLSTAWKNVFKNHKVHCHEEFQLDLYKKYTSVKSTVFIDSVNQMALYMGCNECLKCLMKLSSDGNVEQLILVLHKDCIFLNSKFETYLNYIANSTISYDSSNPCKVCYKLKKSSKLSVTEEILSYDSRTSTLKSMPVINKVYTNEIPENISPGNLTTFKIEVDQIEKMEKSKLKLPYMSKINEGESKVFYEPDAVDDWDEEDPDEDLDI